MLTTQDILKLLEQNALDVKAAKLEGRFSDVQRLLFHRMILQETLLQALNAA